MLTIVNFKYFIKLNLKKGCILLFSVQLISLYLFDFRLMLSTIISSWLNKFDLTTKSKQSPINIDPSVAFYSKFLRKNKISLKYDPKCFEEIKNNGHTFIVSGSSTSGYSQSNYRLIYLSFCVLLIWKKFKLYF